MAIIYAWLLHKLILTEKVIFSMTESTLNPHNHQTSDQKLIISVC